MKILHLALILCLSFFTFCSSEAQEPVLLEGWPVMIFDSSPFAAPLQGLTVYDINNDGYLEIFLSFGNKIYAYDYGGNPLPNWPYVNSNEDNQFGNSPVIGDIDGDNEPEIVLDWRNAYQHTAGLIAVNPDGSLCDGFPVDLSGNEAGTHLTLFDLNSDRALEIIVGINRLSPDSLNQLRVYSGNGDFYPGWPVDGLYVLGIAAGDIENDGEIELVVTTSNNYNGLLYALESNGSVVEGFPVDIGGTLDSVLIKDQPVLFDLDGNGTLEIGVLYGTPRITPPLTLDYVSIYNYQGHELDHWPYYSGVYAPVSLSIGKDISDNQVYVVFGGSYNGQFFLLNAHDGNLVNGWPFHTPHPSACNWDRPSIGDIDGDGSSDYIFNYNVARRDSVTGLFEGRIWALNKHGELLENFPLWVYGYTFPGGVSLADINNDGIAEMIFHTIYDFGGRPVQRIYAFKLKDILYEEERFPWPMSGHDAQQTNNLNFRMPTSVNDKNNPNLPSVVTLTNHPNPFNSSTIIEYAVEEKGNAQLEIYNLLGQKVATLVDDEILPGKHSVRWNADRFSSGIYFSVLKTGDVKHTRRMVLLK
ncbi:MAG: T9SS type A sorting domain-containing protein [candidate division Zixibacteria bacterium]|nr:T9SS type A sorting domain-containing protein [candidate division Zixibacteria bacterium]